MIVHHSFSRVFINDKLFLNYETLITGDRDFHGIPERIAFYTSLEGHDDTSQPDFVVIVTRKK